MKKQLIAILYILPLLLWSNLTQASSLDELYRDIMRSDNQGYLPLFVKNRKTPDILGIASSTSEVAPLEIKTASKTNNKQNVDSAKKERKKRQSGESLSRKRSR